jgi:hypothetical protein
VASHSRQEDDVVTAHCLSWSGIEQNQMIHRKGKTTQWDIVNLPEGGSLLPVISVASLRTRSHAPCLLELVPSSA